MANFYPPNHTPSVRTIAIDFDGVLHNAHSGWGDGTCYGNPLPGAIDGIKRISANFDIIIYTAKARSDRPLVDGKSGVELVEEWLQKYDILHCIRDITAEKPRADLYIDDNAHFFIDWKTGVEHVFNTFYNDIRMYEGTQYDLELSIFKRASLIRCFEEELYDLINKKLFSYPIYLSAGQEFISATIAEFMSIHGYTPALFAQHRSHSVYLAFGGSVEKLIDELLGRSTGCAGGMGGSASIQCREINMFGHDGMMGSQVPISVGYAFATKFPVISIMGDASAEEDYVMSSIAWAGTKKMPILFVVEDNNLSILTEKSVRRNWSMVDFAKSVNVNAVELDDEPIQLWKYLSVVSEYVSNNGDVFASPLLLNVKTDRLFWHANAGTDDYEKRDRYLLEMEKLGSPAAEIHNKTKEYIKELWNQKLHLDRQ